MKKMAPFCLKKSEGQIYIRNDNPCVTCSWHFWENVPYMGHIPVIFSLRSHFSLLYYLHDTSFSKVLLLTYMCLNSKMNLLSKHSIRSFFFFFLSSTSLLLPSHLPPPSARMLSHVTPWTAARQAPLSMDFSRQESWSRLPFPSPGS